jgi:hypothetical protein
MGFHRSTFSKPNTEFKVTYSLKCLRGNRKGPDILILFYSKWDVYSEKYTLRTFDNVTEQENETRQIMSPCPPLSQWRASVLKCPKLSTHMRTHRHDLGPFPAHHTHTPWSHTPHLDCWVAKPYVSRSGTITFWSFTQESLLGIYSLKTCRIISFLTWEGRRSGYWLHSFPSTVIGDVSLQRHVQTGSVNHPFSPLPSNR